MLSQERLKSVELYAWVGEDEMGSGVIGLKQGLVTAGCIPLVATSLKVGRESLVEQMNYQANAYGKKIYLCKFVFSEVMIETTAGEPLC